MSDLISGFVAGMTQTVIGHPFDTTKVRLQTSTSNLRNTVVSIFRNEGLRGFYKGYGPPLLINSVINKSSSHFNMSLKVLFVTFNHEGIELTVPKFSFVADKDILPGEELLTFYGDQYIQTMKNENIPIKTLKAHSWKSPWAYFRPWS